MTFPFFLFEKVTLFFETVAVLLLNMVYALHVGRLRCVLILILLGFYNVFEVQLLPLKELLPFKVMFIEIGLM